VAAKNDAAHQSLVAQFAERTTEKLYLAVAQAAPSPRQGTVFTHIARHRVNRQKMDVVSPPLGKPAITDYETLATDPADGTSLVLCRLHTGRTHQIRVHMRHLGAPLLGDPIYAHPTRQPRQPGRLMLHAWRLSFDHPRTGQRIRAEAPVPSAFSPWTALGELP
jgi:23S rRNA pseudouridine1911/1915/1917 synthase